MNFDTTKTISYQERTKAMLIEVRRELGGHGVFIDPIRQIAFEYAWTFEEFADVDYTQVDAAIVERLGPDALPLVKQEANKYYQYRLARRREELISNWT